MLLKLKERADALPQLSEQLGNFVRTNSESLIGVVSNRKDLDFSQGVAIGSILQTDEHSHLEPCRYPPGSDFFRCLAAPHVAGDNALGRLSRLLQVLWLDVPTVNQLEDGPEVIEALARREAIARSPSDARVGVVGQCPSVLVVPLPVLFDLRLTISSRSLGVDAAVSRIIEFLSKLVRPV